MFLVQKLDNKDEREEKFIIQATSNDHINVDIFPSNILYIFSVCDYSVTQHFFHSAKHWKHFWGFSMHLFHSIPFHDYIII